jgi:hypothetical protein
MSFTAASDRGFIEHLKGSGILPNPFHIFFVSTFQTWSLNHSRNKSRHITNVEFIFISFGPAKVHSCNHAGNDQKHGSVSDTKARATATSNAKHKVARVETRFKHSRLRLGRVQKTIRPELLGIGKQCLIMCDLTVDVFPCKRQQYYSRSIYAPHVYQLSLYYRRESGIPCTHLQPLFDAAMLAFR